MPAGSSLEDHRGNSSVCFVDLLFQFVPCRRLVVVPTPTADGRRSLGSPLPAPTHARYQTLCDLSSNVQRASSRDGGSGLDANCGTSRHHTSH